MNTNDHKLIDRCISKDRKAQNELFHLLGPKMLSICRRYLTSTQEAEDALITGFAKVFEKLDTIQKKGNLEAWVKRIIINECLMIIRKNKRMPQLYPIEEMAYKLDVPFVDHLYYNDVLKLLNQLPTGYRTVFNLYVIEGYKHREIADIMNISINTSKSQLILARKKLSSMIKKKVNKKIA